MGINMEKENHELAILLTCYNRKDLTIRCIKSLIAQEDMPTFDLYVCDDNSTDGTCEAIYKIYPKAVIIQGTGSLYWTKGMYYAMEAAYAHGYKYFLMINDDVEFFPTMWCTMFEAFKNSDNIGIVGYTISRTNNHITYGGSRMVKTKSKYYIGERIELSKNSFVEVDVANWNCFLITRGVIDKVGLIDSYYEHSLGDYDYCLQMKKNDLHIYATKEVVGYCENNDRENTYLDGTLPRIERFKKMSRPNGFPVRSWIHFVKKNYSGKKIRSIISPYAKNLYAIMMKRNII